MLRPSNAKYRFAGSMEKLLRQPHGLTALMLNDKNDCVILNTDHQPYTNLIDPNGIDTSSYEELYAQSLQKAVRLITDYDPSDISVNFLGIPVTDQPTM